jgi:hypothetical protein
MPKSLLHNFCTKMDLPACTIDGTGTLHDGRFDGLSSALGQSLHITDTMGPDVVQLDNADDRFTITRFTAGC